MTLDEGYPTRLLQHMVSISSTSGDEATLASFLLEEMTRLGFDARVDEVGNLIGDIGPADGPRVLLLGHLDTVPGTIPVCRIGNLLYGRGTVDAKGALAAMICAAASGGSGVRVTVAGAVGEEIAGSFGARHLTRTLPTPDAVLVGEPSGWDGICLGYKGRTGIVYEVNRPAMHTSSPEETAVEAATEFWSLVRGYATGLAGGSDFGAFNAPSATLVSLSGDIRQASAYVTFRVPLGFDFEALRSFVRRIAVHADVRLDEQVPAVRRGMRDPAASALRGAIRAHGAEPRMKLKAGTSDMNIIGDTWSSPMAAYGPGDAHLDHTDDEHIPLGDLNHAVEVLRDGLHTLGESLRPRTKVGSSASDPEFGSDHAVSPR